MTCKAYHVSNFASQEFRLGPRRYLLHPSWFFPVDPMIFYPSSSSSLSRKLFCYKKNFKFRCRPQNILPWCYLFHNPWYFIIWIAWAATTWTIGSFSSYSFHLEVPLEQRCETNCYNGACYFLAFFLLICNFLLLRIAVIMLFSLNFKKN